ncbi:hypothetical protein RchiOBHm_Chr6g0292741 [Rosa chinensis]|uniref:Uncharacterized protein n=1 Tax=Rosa chinensis TaxID=74649 RepID=A0A2P6PWF9_ROSCH|nr:hypothetical protein RchiOBHm_Chr6g0292741 [Rosa chinensis]
MLRSIAMKRFPSSLTRPATVAGAAVSLFSDCECGVDDLGDCGRGVLDQEYVFDLQWVAAANVHGASDSVKMIPSGRGWDDDQVAMAC